MTADTPATGTSATGTATPAEANPGTETGRALEAYLAGLRPLQERLRPAGTPHRVHYPLGELTLPEYVDEWARRRPETTAIAFEGTRISYADLAERVARIAGWMESVGVTAGDRVAVFMPNAPQFVITMLAALRLGAVHVPVNPMFQATELSYELADSGATVVVTFDELYPRLATALETDGVNVARVLVTGPRELASEASPPTAVEGEVTRWAEAVAAEPVPVRSHDIDALAALNYTGGTTGLPKGCQHTQRHMIYTAASSAGATRESSETGFVAVCYIPIFWIAGENLGILNPLVLGGTVVLLSRWNARTVLEAIETHGATTMVGTVENYLELLDQPDLGERDLSTLRDPMAVSFVRKMTPEVRAAWQAAVGDHSVLREGAYGMTETHTMDVTPFGLAEADADLRAEPVFCGIPVPGTDVAVVDFTTGMPLPLGEAGEILVRSPSVMTGYWNKPEATARQLVGGWLHTGDNGRIDDQGCLHYLGRDKDMIKVNGMSVFPAEVELLLCGHPGVRTVAVVAAEHPDTGQTPVAFVNPNPEADLDPDELRTWARDQMAGYKVPVVEVVEDFPMTATGKIRKVELADRAQQIVDARR
ncbi:MULTISPECIES: AMP-binding protein [Prauserella salsuginis group]|uniref:AMP-binding protein n=1 Tax=Prauserella salsuginis TaxID=387889 RepID=A0ABW6G7X3_9PSEU|nr:MULTISPECIES: AMP-binding protein [Prauserella salsuginis group]MCR3719669.1 long-chain acyl-CoA synthetase [Prauserella flava]MCR3735318.1 long-chain acyl-CoA synthetase [Prauserella salsuginis]